MPPTIPFPLPNKRKWWFNLGDKRWRHQQMCFCFSTLWLRVFSKSPDEVNATDFIASKGVWIRPFSWSWGSHCAPSAQHTLLWDRDGNRNLASTCLLGSCHITNCMLSRWWIRKQLMVQPLLLWVEKTEFLFIFHCCLKYSELKKGNTWWLMLCLYWLSSHPRFPNAKKYCLSTEMRY